MRKLVILPLAEQDLDDLIEYLSGFYPSTALRQYDRIIDSIRHLADFPFRHEKYMGGIFKLDFRKMVVDKYLVFYVVKDTEIEIHRILYGGFNISTHLVEFE